MVYVQNSSKILNGSPPDDLDKDGPHSLIWVLRPGLWGPCQSSLGVLVLVHPGEGGAHVVEVDAEVADGGLGVVVAVELGDCLDRDAGTV